MKSTLIGALTLFAVAFCHAGERETGDYNFDGHADYRVYRESDGKMHYYDFYLFDPRTKKYVLSSELSHLFNPQFDPATKEIHCFSPGGWGGALFYREDYKWQGTHPVLIRIIKQTDLSFNSSADGHGLVRVTATIKGGKPSIDSIEAITEEPYIPR